MTESTFAKFWQDRFAAHGHTGWFDPRIYAFDQRCRLGLFSQWLDDQIFSGKLALDFGAGSGDFSRLLIDKGWRVVSYDKHVLPRFQHKKLQIASSVAVVAKLAPYDLIISITVLDHVMDDTEFGQQLVDFGSWLKPDAKFFFLEYSSALARRRSSYQAFRTINMWKDALAAAKLRLETVEPFFHPDEAPVPAYTSYRASLIAKAHERLRHLQVPLALTRPLLAKAAKKALRQHPYSAPASSAIHILCGTTPASPHE
jgi:2-polyprenyl-3-methyl-5-hydroxy-6-metoxy-1,4-benzoquinol methylase